MRPAADREYPHDGDLQRNDGAGDQPDRQVEGRIGIGGNGTGADEGLCPGG